jgi:nucleoside-diphosphate-sugar epimerase
MKILITGNLGYVGPVLVRHLKRALPSCYLVGFDSGFFAHCLTGASVLPETQVDLQYFGDVRKLPDQVLSGVDAIIHLSAISNDPMGLRYEDVTRDINFHSSIELAKRAIASGVKRFVFASSCSIYGFAEGGPRKESDELNPLTAYAKSKAATEAALSGLDLRSTVVTSLRFSTACGMSERLRLDLVLNDFVACAMSAHEITVLSDGSPWRPLIDVKDMSRAIEWALSRDPSGAGQYLTVNVGSQEWNYQVKELAEAVARAVPGTKVTINTNAPPDKRSYRVDFSLFQRIAPRHQPQVTLQQSIEELKSGLTRMKFNDSAFRTSQFMRLKVLEKHTSEGLIDPQLYWIR